MQVIAWQIWYDGGRLYKGTTIDELLALPGDGVQVLMLYFDQEWAPNRPYRMACMGNDRYFYNPTTGVWGHSDEKPAEIRRRYGSDTLIWNGRWTTTAEYDACRAAAMAAEDLPP